MKNRLTSLIGQKTSTTYTNADTSKALFQTLLAGKNFQGEFSSAKGYAQGDVIIYNDPVDGPVTKEALTSIPAGKVFTSSDWDSPSTGTPFSNYGTVTLSNTEVYPFNNSEVVITLKKQTKDTNYLVLISCNDKNVERINVYDKQVNGFKMSYDGSSTSVSLTYYIY